MNRSISIVSAVLCIALWAEQAPSFTGLWKLNVSHSSWGRKQSPASVVVDIQDSQPMLKYSGVVVDVQGEERQFEFAGATDGREYPAIRSCGEGRAVLERLGPSSILLTFKANEGGVVERTRMTLSRNGKRLTYNIEITDGSGALRWTEVYDRQ